MRNRSKIIRRERGWFIVSDIFTETTFGKIGSGWIWAQPFATRALARAFKRSPMGAAL